MDPLTMSGQESEAEMRVMSAPRCPDGPRSKVRHLHRRRTDFSVVIDRGLAEKQRETFWSFETLPSPAKLHTKLLWGGGGGSPC